MATAQVTSPSTEAAGRRPQSRLLYLDNLKVFLVAAVIVAHAGFTYVASSHFGSLSPGELVKAAVSLGIVVGVGFAMGTFFLMAGLLAPKSLSHRGTGGFMRERLLRLGVPFVVFLFIIWPALYYLVYLATHSGPQETLWAFFVRQMVRLDSNALWFVAVLLIFSASYAGWRRIHPYHEDHRQLRPIYLFALAAAIAVPTFAVRLIWRLDSWQFLNLHIWQWPQYGFMFWFGTVSAEHGWLRSLPDRWWRLCGLTAIVAILCIPVLVLTGGILNGQLVVFEGGWHWQAVVAAGLEGALTVSMSLWLIEYFRRAHNHQGTLGRQLARCAYGAYLVQIPVLKGLWLALRQVAISPELKFLLIAPAAVIISYGIAWLVIIRFRIATRIL